MKGNHNRQTGPSLRSWLRPVCLLAGLSILAGCTATAPPPAPVQHSSHSAATDGKHAAADGKHAAADGKHAAAAPTPRIPAFFANAEQARPLPAVLDPKQFSDPVIAKAYRYAQELPAIFAQQPCYCYCDDGHGHRSLLDCYASDHSVGCVLCLKEGLLVHQLYQQGMNATDIRERIVRGGWQNVKLE